MCADTGAVRARKSRIATARITTSTSLKKQIAASTVNQAPTVPAFVAGAGG